MKRLRILVADDDRAMLSRVEKLLNGSFDIIATVENGQLLLNAAAELDPDVLVVDIGMPVMNGIDAVRKYKSARGGGHVLFLSNYLEPVLIEAALECGADGFVPKTRAAEELVPAVIEVASGRKYFSPSLSAVTSEA